MKWLFLKRLQHNSFIFQQLQFEDDLRISKMFSSDGEGVPFSEQMYPRGNVEDWLLEVERVMQASLMSILHRAIVAYEGVSLSRLSVMVAR